MNNWIAQLISYFGGTNNIFADCNRNYCTTIKMEGEFETVLNSLKEREREKIYRESEEETERVRERVRDIQRE